MRCDTGRAPCSAGVPRRFSIIGTKLTRRGISRHHHLDLSNHLLIPVTHALVGRRMVAHELVEQVGHGGNLPSQRSSWSRDPPGDPEGEAALRDGS